MPDVKIKGWSGNAFAYQNVKKVWLESAESTEESPVLVPYTYGEAVSKTVEPDFSAGDMEVPIADGELVTELTIAKPETLVPDNVANGVNIAGVVGTYDGGGGGGDDGVVFCAHPYIISKKISTSPDTFDVKSVVSIPKDAQLLSCSFKAEYHYYDSSLKEYNLDEIDYACNPSDFYTYSEENGYKNICVFSKTYVISDATVLTIAAAFGTGSALYKQYSVSLRNGRVEATSLCQGFEGYHDGVYPAYSYGQYIEEVDLRSSVITALLRGTFSCRGELKKVWLPETLTDMKAIVFSKSDNMEELHFASEEPPKTLYDTFSSANGLSRTCKIYVPAGKIDAYKSAIPGLKNYICIEE